MEKKAELNNPYVRNFYNEHVGSLHTSYADSRWHSSPAQAYDYIQTSRAIDQALKKATYTRAIEVGPGDAVWTPKLLSCVSGQIHLIEQSDAMLAQAREKLKTESRVTFERADFMEAHPPQEADLLISIRCFEYFKDKPAGLKKMFSLLKPGGKLIIVTKNADLYTTKNVQSQQVHSGQVSKREMSTMLKAADFTIEAVYPAVLRWKIKYWLPRTIFNFLQKQAVLSNGRFSIPWLFSRATESFTYVAKRP